MCHLRRSDRPACGQHDSTTIDTFGQELGAMAEFDPGTFEFDNQARVHGKGCIESWADIARGFDAQRSDQRSAIIDDRCDGRISKIGDERISSRTTNAASVDPTSSVSGLDAWKRG